MTKKGFTLSEMLVVLAIIGILTAATAPMFTTKKKIKDYEISSATCVRKEQAADLNSTACTAAVNKAQFGQDSAISTLSFLANNGKDTDEKTAASKVLRQACDNGGDQACSYFVTACQRDSTLCDMTGTFDLRYYLELMPNTNDSPKFLMADYAKPFYDSNNTNIKSAVDNYCCPSFNMACVINGTTDCPWAKHYGGELASIITKIVISGNYIYACGYETDDTTGVMDGFVIKLDKKGTTIWTKHYGGTEVVSFFSLAVLNDDIYVAGIVGTEDNSIMDILVTKLNTSDGTVQWKKQYGTANPDTPNAIIATGNHIYFTYVPENDATAIVKLNASDGTTIWKKHFEDMTSDGGFFAPTNAPVILGEYMYFTGISRLPGISWSKMYIIKINTSDAKTVWAKTYGNNIYTEGRSLAISGNYIYVTGAGLVDGLAEAALIVMKFDLNGVTQWKKYYASPNQAGSAEIAVSRDDVYIVGLEDLGAGINNTFAIKIRASNGSSVWKNHYGSADGTPFFGGTSIAASDNYAYMVGMDSSDETGGEGKSVAMKIGGNQTTSNITNWMADGVNITNWTSDGAAFSIDGVDVTNWTVAGENVVGWTSNGVNMDPSKWTYNGALVRKGPDFWDNGLKKDGVPVP